MKKNYFLILLLAIFNLSCHACFKAIFESEKSPRKLSEQKNRIQELNKPREIIIKRGEGAWQSIERYILSSEAEIVAWQLKVLTANPNNCLEIETDNSLSQTPSWNPDESPCYYIWKLRSKSIGQATLQIDQLINKKIAHTQWVEVTITD